MAVMKAELILMCLFCGALAQSDADVMNIYDLLSKVSDRQEITIDDLLPESTIDDAGVVQESLDNDLDDAIHLELANTELLGGCRNGVCSYCSRKKAGLKFCFEARRIRLGFKLKVTVNKRTLFRKEISVRNPPPICKGVPFVGKACVRLYNVDIKKRSACIRVEFKVGFGRFKKSIKLKIACFSLGKKEVTSPSISTMLLQELVDEEINSVE